MCPSTINLHNFWQEFVFLINVLYSSIGYEKNYGKGRSKKGVSRTAKMCEYSLATKFIKCVLWNDKSTPFKSDIFKGFRFLWFRFDLFDNKYNKNFCYLAMPIYLLRKTCYIIITRSFVWRNLTIIPTIFMYRVYTTQSNIAFKDQWT